MPRGKLTPNQLLFDKIDELEASLEEMTKCRDNALQEPLKLAAKIVELNEENQTLFNKVKELEGKVEWKPMDTCKKEDTHGDNTILLLTQEGQIIEGYWTQEGHEWIAMYYCDDYYNSDGEPVVFNGFEPEAWMPKPPTKTKESDAE